MRGRRDCASSGLGKKKKEKWKRGNWWSRIARVASEFPLIFPASISLTSRTSARLDHNGLFIHLSTSSSASSVCCVPHLAGARPRMAHGTVAGIGFGCRETEVLSAVLARWGWQEPPAAVERGGVKRVNLPIQGRYRGVRASIACTEISEFGRLFRFQAGGAWNWE